MPVNEETKIKLRQFDPKELMDERGNLLKLLYSVAETAFLLNCHEKTIRRFIERTLLKTSKATRHVQITRQSILTFMDSTV